MATAAASGPSRPAFDPAAHLTKQGWKGKGTALKNGHLTRPLAVVQKRTLAGVGKDRDEAVPFWDNIFAATAASLSLPTTPSGSGASTPLGNGSSNSAHRLADPRSSQTTAWQTGGSAAASASASPAPGQGGAGASRRPALSAMVRVGQETARRGLYSRFFRGKVVVLEPEEPEVEAQEEQTSAGPSSLTPSQTISAQRPVSGAPKQAESPIATETKEERRARRAAKAARKEEKAQRKEARAARRLERAKVSESEVETGAPAGVAVVDAKGTRTVDEDGQVDEVGMALGEDAAPGSAKHGESKKIRREKKRDKMAEGQVVSREAPRALDSGLGSLADVGAASKRKKRRREEA